MAWVCCGHWAASGLTGIRCRRPGTQAQPMTQNLLPGSQAQLCTHSGDDLRELPQPCHPTGATGQDRTPAAQHGAESRREAAHADKRPGESHQSVTCIYSFGFPVFVRRYPEHVLFWVEGLQPQLEIHSLYHVDQPCRVVGNSQHTCFTEGKPKFREVKSLPGCHTANRGTKLHALLR